MTESSDLTCLAEGIYLVPGRRGGRYPHCNSLFIDTGERAVIDPGSNRKLLRGLSEKGVGRVFLSHFHSDHLREIRELPSSDILVHEIEKAAVEGWEGMSALVWFPEEVKDPTWISRKNKEVGGWGWPVRYAFQDRETFTVGEVSFQVVHVPGHTPGHCGFWFPEHGILYSADIDLTEFGPWYGNAASDPARFMDSINLVKSLQPPVMVTGHEAAVVRENIPLRLEAYAGILKGRHRRILDFLSSPRTLDEVVEQGFIYGEYFSKNNSSYKPEWRMVRHHLEWAKQNQEVSEERGRFVRL
ncbi:MAG: MBL fold metallo-hydrolase [bacterium]